jgi:signal transduction histidine kinase
MPWVRRVTGDQFGPTRLIPLAFFTGYLVLGHFLGEPGAWRIPAMAGVLLLIRGGVWPLYVAIGEAALVVVASLMPDPPAVSAMISLAGLALLELAIRRPLRQAAIGALALIAAYAIGSLNAPPEGYLAAPALGIILFGDILNGGVVVPLLLGACIRLAARQGRVRAEERGAAAVREARQAERTEIARELHDLVAHHVASMALRVGIAREVVPDVDPRIRVVLDDVHNAATTTLTDLRRLVGVLRDPATDAAGSRLVHVDPADLPAAVNQVIDLSALAGLEVEHRVDPAIANLDSVRGLAVLRLVQEGLTNVTNHAPGARATVRVELTGDEVHVEVIDDGGAQERPQPLPGTESGYGLVGLRERVELIGGALTAGPRGGGWRLRATMPMTVPELQ